MPSPAYPTLPTGPLGHLALDHERLRAEGLRLLGHLAGAQWTDFNPTDPGITILEQLCYAITDLAYRTDHPIPDLLAGTDLAVALPGPAAILSCDPVTPDDLRKLVLDVDGVRSAVFDPLDEPELPVYHHPGSNELRLVPDPSEPDLRPLALLGLARLALQTESLDSSDLVLARAAAQVHAHRGLGEDITLAPLGTQQVWVQARVEVAPTDDPAALQAEILERLEAHLAPAVHFTALADAAEDERLDALFEGPALRHGFIREELPATRRSIRTSDLLHVITDLPAVRAVRSIALATSRDGQRERWVLPLPAGQVAVIAADSEITLLRGGLPLRVDPVRVRTLLDERRLAARARSRAAVQDGPAPTPGRDRKLARYRSIQHDFPAVYGIGPLGLPAPASATRQAQARQLEAYLLIFDQLLANQFAQLAHARELLSPDVAAAPTYHAQPVVDPRLRLAALVHKTPGEQPQWLAELVERVSAGDDPHGRRKRFLAHLLARHAEQIGDYAQIGGASEASGQALVEDRESFLRNISRLGAARGSGRDLLGDIDAPSGLEQRLRLKLGLREPSRFHLVEHILLRPLPEDIRQLGDDSLPQVPLFADVAGRDPWSLQVSFVFEAREGGAPGDAFERMVADAILAETPAHLRPHLLWLDAAGADTFAAFDAAWSEFRAAHRAYRRERMRGTQMPEELHLVLRDARDRLVDLLGLGRSYPLRDLPVPRLMMVPPFHPAIIAIPFSQRGVVYVLCDEASGKPIVLNGKPIELAGTGGTISLTTPIIDKDKLYRILAVKLADRDTEHHREAWLHATVRVEKGVDPTLTARIVGQPLLIPSDNDQPPPDAARIANYNTIVQVEVLASQEGVFYELVNDANMQVVSLDPPVASPGGTIVLKTRAVLEDFDLRVRGVRPGIDGQAEGTRTALLTLVLPLRVRANPALTAEILGGPIVDHANVPTPRSLWAAGAAPPVTIAAPAPIELGLKLRADVAGQITAIRFYKGAATLGTHVVNLWRADGTSLATASLPIADASAAPIGWQQVTFASPVPIAAATTYIASYFAPSGGWSHTPDLLAAAGLDREPLHALRSGVDGPNAVARAGDASAFPNAPLDNGTSYDWLDVVFTPTPVAPTLRLLKTQASVEYRVYRRRVRDSEFVLGAAGPAPVLEVVDAGRTIRVLRPTAPIQWADLVPVGEARKGNGGALELPLGAFTEDAYVFVQATKHHRISPQDAGPIDSVIMQNHIQPVLVRPDAQASPSLTVPVVGPATAGPITVQNGQPGVYLELRAAGGPVGKPAYFHQRDDLAPALNKGIEQMVIETDLAVARSHDGDPPGLEKLAPPPPQIETSPLPLPTVIHVVARKAFSGLTAELSRFARLTPTPAVQAMEPTVPPGGATQIRITASRPDTTYQLLRNNELVATGPGNGGPLELATGPLDAKTTFEVVSFGEDPATLHAECRTTITVDVA